MSKKPFNTKKEFTMTREEYIEHLSLRTNEVHMTTKNSKTGSAIIDLAFPVNTCRDDAPCKGDGCYCCKGTQSMAVVQGAYYRNWRLYNEDPVDFWNQVKHKIKWSGLSKVRYFDSGDIPDYAFLIGACMLAKELPNVKFMAFTKKYFLVNTYLEQMGKLPDNFNIIFSAWDKNWVVDNPYNLPVAYVDFKDKSKNPVIPEKHQLCPNQKDKTITCSMCGKCWRKDLGSIVFHQH